ncbi:MAG: hydroxymethylbilane synthase [Acidimicrobiales bacterium]
MSLRAATRGSPLARWQTDHVARLIAGTGGPDVEAVVVSTVGDRRHDVPIHVMGGKGVFVKEVQVAVLEGHADIAVHSAKDLPAIGPAGLVLGAVPERGDARDALVGGRFADLAPGARVGTGSVRRRSQLAWHRPDLTFCELRGAIATRLDKAAGLDAIVMAAAALERLGHIPTDPGAGGSGRVIDVLPVSLMVPQVAQGAIAVECRADDHRTLEMLAAIECRDTRRIIDSERAFLQELGGDCDLPAGAHAVITDAGLELEGMLASLDGRVMLRERRDGVDGAELGRTVARHLLDDAGGAELLADRR